MSSIEKDRQGFNNFDRVDVLIEREYHFQYPPPEIVGTYDRAYERRRGAEVVLLLLNNHIFTDTEIKSILYNSGDHLLYLREKMGFRGMLADLLMVTAKGVKVAKVDSVRSDIIRSTVRKLASLTPEQWEKMGEDALSTGYEEQRRHLNRVFRPLIGLPPIHDSMDGAARDYLMGVNSSSDYATSLPRVGMLRNVIDALRGFEPVQDLKHKFELINFEEALREGQRTGKPLFSRFLIKRAGEEEPITVI